MNLTSYLFFVGILWTVLLTIKDLRDNQIENRYLLVVALVGLVINLLISNSFFVDSLIYGGFFLLIGFLVAISGGWGGADGKFMGVLGIYFHPVSILLLVSLIFSTVVFKAYLLLTDQDPGDIPREEWLEKGVAFFPSFLLAVLLAICFHIMFII